MQTETVSISQYQSDYTLEFTAVIIALLFASWAINYLHTIKTQADLRRMEAQGLISEKKKRKRIQIKRIPEKECQDIENSQIQMENANIQKLSVTQFEDNSLTKQRSNIRNFSNFSLHKSSLGTYQNLLAKKYLNTGTNLYSMVIQQQKQQKMREDQEIQKRRVYVVNKKQEQKNLIKKPQMKKIDTSSQSTQLGSKKGQVTLNSKQREISKQQDTFVVKQANCNFSDCANSSLSKNNGNVEEKKGKQIFGGDKKQDHNINGNGSSLFNNLGFQTKPKIPDSGSRFTQIQQNEEKPKETQAKQAGAKEIQNIGKNQEKPNANAKNIDKPLANEVSNLKTDSKAMIDNFQQKNKQKPNTMSAQNNPSEQNKDQKPDPKADKPSNQQPPVSPPPPIEKPINKPKLQLKDSYDCLEFFIQYSKNLNTETQIKSKLSNFGGARSDLREIYLFTNSFIRSSIDKDNPKEIQSFTQKLWSYIINKCIKGSNIKEGFEKTPPKEKNSQVEKNQILTLILIINYLRALGYEQIWLGVLGKTLQMMKFLYNRKTLIEGLEKAVIESSDKEKIFNKFDLMEIGYISREGDMSSKYLSRLDFLTFFLLGLTTIDPTLFCLEIQQKRRRKPQILEDIEKNNFKWSYTEFWCIIDQMKKNEFQGYYKIPFWANVISTTYLQQAQNRKDQTKMRQFVQLENYCFKIIKSMTVNITKQKQNSLIMELQFQTPKYDFDGDSFINSIKNLGKSMQQKQKQMKTTNIEQFRQKNSIIYYFWG